MNNKQSQISNKKSGGWVILPVLIIALFSFIIYRIIQARNVISLPKTDRPVISDSCSTFSPEQLVDMVDKNEDYIAGVCKKNSFNYYVDPDNKIFSYVYRIRESGEWVVLEAITTWENFPNRLNYCLVDESKYNNFISKIINRSPIYLPKKQHDKYSLDSAHLLVNDCVFIPAGYKKNFGGYCIIAIRNDKIILVNDSNDSTKEDEHYLYINKDGACVYNTPHSYDKGVTFLNAGIKVKFHETDGEFIFCDYTNESGITLSKWLLISDLTKKQTSSEVSEENKTSAQADTN